VEKNTYISIIIPAFNEAEVIHKSLDQISKLKLYEKYEIIFVDDGSTDGTGEIIRKYPVKLVTHHVNKGYGASLKTGIRKATGNKIIIMDSDGQHDPKYVEQISGMLDEYDMVIGERTADSYQVSNRQSGKRLIRLIGEHLVEQKLPDFNSGFRGFNRDLIHGMLHIMPNGFSFSTTSTLAFLKEGYSIGTFPIKVEAREGRKSNVKFMKDGSKTILLLLRIIMLFNPLKIFFPASLIILLLGLGWGIAGYILTDRLPNSSLIILMMSIFVFFVGLLADQIALLNRSDR
jgi:glycosyltransferase involved in cell wall biosynthesis